MHRSRLFAWLIWAFAAALVAVALSRLVPVCRDQLAAPFDLISEGPHMCTVKAIRTGYDIYSRSSFLDLPFFMTPYTPLYHVVVASLPQNPANPFFTGRVVAAFFMLVAAAGLFVAAGAGHRATAAIAIAVFFLIHSVTGNTAYLRSDSTALCFAVWAVVVAARARSTRAIVATGVLCALAVAAKQSFIAAPLACFVYFMLRNRRQAGVFVLAGGVAGAVLALAASAYWGRDFWLAVTIPMTDYPRDIESFFLHWRMMFRQPVFLFLVAAALVVTVIAVARGQRAVFATPFFPYLVLTWIFQTWVMTGIGAENHNLIEPVLATLLWIVACTRSPAETLAARRAWTVGLAVLALVVAWEMRNPSRASYSYTTEAKTVRYVNARAAVNAALRHLGIEHGRMLNLKNSQVVHDFDGEWVVNDVWMYITVLWNSRPETTERLIGAVDDEYFDAVVISPGIFSAAQEAGRNYPISRIFRAVFTHYQVAIHGEEVNVLTRRRGSPAGPRQ